MGPGGRGRGRGRQRGMRRISDIPENRSFAPGRPMPPDREPVVISLEELEAIRLVDLEDLTQEEAAATMGISRRTLWGDLHRARKKVVLALVQGREIIIEGGDYVLR